MTNSGVFFEPKGRIIKYDRIHKPTVNIASIQELREVIANFTISSLNPFLNTGNQRVERASPFLHKLSVLASFSDSCVSVLVFFLY